MNLTYGAEIELADWSRDIKIPSELGVIDKNDTSVANSDGTRVNPYVSGGRGGEICTAVNKSPSSLVSNIISILDLLDTYKVNHTCWLHIHVGIPKEYYNTLDKLKDILIYVRRNSFYIRDFTDISPPRVGPNMLPEHRIRRNLTRTSIMSDGRYNNALFSQNYENFWEQFDNKRHMINMRPLKSQGTIEFRFFHMTTNPLKLFSPPVFCKDFILDMFSEEKKDVVGLLYEKNYSFAKPVEYDREIEDGFTKSKIDNKPKINNFTGELWQ